MATGSSIRDPGGDIALWGPTGSGKTWLIHALAKELVWYSRHDPEFDYQVMDQAGMPVDISPPSLSVIGPTHGHEDRSWQFQRTPRQESKSHQISAHTHNINVHDDKGASLVEALQIPDQHPMTLITLRESTNVIALLDPTLLESSSVQSPINLISGSASSNLKSKAEYAQMIQYLCHLMVSQARNQDERYLAVCITKIDLLNIRRDPNILVEPLFGTSMAHILDSYKNQIKIKIFATSAVGYYWDSSKRKSNYDPATREVRYPSSWEPFNVAAPFFWIFECNERLRLNRGWLGPFRQENYLGYPSPRR